MYENEIIWIGRLLVIIGWIVGSIMALAFSMAPLLIIFFIIKSLIKGERITKKEEAIDTNNLSDINIKNIRQIAFSEKWFLILITIIYPILYIYFLIKEIPLIKYEKSFVLLAQETIGVFLYSFVLALFISYFTSQFLSWVLMKIFYK
jgi:hypothetical protein